MKPRAFLTTALALTLACTSVAADPRPLGLQPNPATDEGGLWEVSAKAERGAQQSADINKDPALNAYVRSVTCKVAAPYCDDIRIYVMDREVFNAQMAPNGYSEVWTGLLLRATNEAELAFVLGHEAGLTPGHARQAVGRRVRLRRRRQGREDAHHRWLAAQPPLRH